MLPLRREVPAKSPGPHSPTGPSGWAPAWISARAVCGCNWTGPQEFQGQDPGFVAFRMLWAAVGVQGPRAQRKPSKAEHPNLSDSVPCSLCVKLNFANPHASMAACPCPRPGKCNSEEPKTPSFSFKLLTNVKATFLSRVLSSLPGRLHDAAASHRRSRAGGGSHL